MEKRGMTWLQKQWRKFHDDFLLEWKPIPLCWWFRKNGWKVPKYFIGHNVFTPSQNAFRFYEDGTESGSSAIAVQNTNINRSVNTDSKVHLRVLIQETGGVAGASTDDWQLQYSFNGGAYANVTTSSTYVKADSASTLSDGGATTNRGTDGITDGSGSFVAGEQSETGLITDHQLTASNFTEHVYALVLVANDVANGNTLDFRVLLNGSTITYSVTPRITVLQTFPQLTGGSMVDGDRDWSTPYQDITLTFDDSVDITPTPSVGDTVAGLTAQVNGGANSALTYVSGNGTSSWKVRRAELIQQDDTVVVDYDSSTGSILAVDDNAPLKTVNDLSITNSLTKRARIEIYDKTDTTITSTTVGYTFGDINSTWSSASTDGSGILDVQYTGANAVGSTTQYIAIRSTNASPTEATVWTFTVR